jgi:hypothetical protein
MFGEARLATTDEDGRDRLGGQKQALGVDVHHAVPLVGVESMEWARVRTYTCVVHQHVEASEVGQGRRRERVGRLFAAHIVLVSPGLRTSGAHLPRGSLGSRDVDVGHRDHGAVVGKLFGDRLAEAASSPGDDGDPSLERPAHLTPHSVLKASSYAEGSPNQTPDS